MANLKIFKNLPKKLSGNNIEIQMSTRVVYNQNNNKEVPTYPSAENSSQKTGSIEQNRKMQEFPYSTDTKSS